MNAPVSRILREKGPVAMIEVKVPGESKRGYQIWIARGFNIEVLPVKSLVSAESLFPIAAMVRDVAAAPMAVWGAFRRVLRGAS